MGQVTLVQAARAHRPRNRQRGKELLTQPTSLPGTCPHPGCTQCAAFGIVFNASDLLQVFS